MPEKPKKSRKRRLNPMERISEVLFGLIMVLTLTCSFSIAGAGRAEVRQMLIGALGCNLAQISKCPERTTHSKAMTLETRMGTISRLHFLKPAFRFRPQLVTVDPGPEWLIQPG
jgi:hypothetical protein